MTPCTRAERMQELACYVFTPDGTFWLVFKPCKAHGAAGERTAVYSPRLDLGNDEAAGDEAAAFKQGDEA